MLCATSIMVRIFIEKCRKIQMPFPIQSMIFSKELFDKGGGANAPRFIGPDKFLCLKITII